MLNSITEASLKYRGIVVIAILSVVVFGLYFYTKMPVDAFPDISPVMVPVFADAHGMAPEEIEKAKLSSYLELLESGKIAKGKHYHIDVPFSVKTETNVLREAGFASVRLIEESYSETFCAAMLVAEK